MSNLQRSPGEEALLSGREIPATNLPDEFWTGRPRLEQVRTAAQNRRVSPDAVLAALLARVSFFTPHEYALSAIVGSRASLNHNSIIVGSSGQGKSSAKDVACELIPMATDVDMVDDERTGSGEGLAAAFLEDVQEEEEVDGKKRKRNVKRQTKRALFLYADEGETMMSAAKRKGATFLSELRTAWSGGTLGAANASAETHRRVPAHSYRCAVVVAFQPGIAASMLGDAAGGTPQRFLWLSATDPTAPDSPPDWDPQPLDWTPPSRLTLPYNVSVDPEISAEIDAARLPVIRGEVELDELESHLTLVRLKIAALLAILDDRKDVNLDDWDLAEMVATTSRNVMESVLDRARIEARLRDHQSDARAIQRAVAVDDATEMRALSRAAASVGRHVHSGKCAPSPCKRACIQRHLSGKSRDIGPDAAIAEALRIGTVNEGPAGTYLPGPVVPR